MTRTASGTPLGGASTAPSAAQLAALFATPVEVATRTVALPSDGRLAAPLSPPLRPLEQALVGPGWAVKRLLEFHAGRTCAHEALTALRPAVEADWLAAGLGRDPEGVPQWPAGVVGSITHTGGLSGGADARDAGASAPRELFIACAVTRRAAALGLDVERHAGLALELRRRVLHDDEERWLSARCASEPERAAASLVFFSAKEAFYKAQFPLTRAFLGFHDVHVELDPARGCFEARALDSTPAGALGAARGAYVEGSGWVATGVTF